MLKPVNYLIVTQLALSAALFALEDEDFDEEESFSSDLEESMIADVSEYPTVAERYHEMQPPVRHHYVLMGEMLYLKPSLDSMPWLYVYDDSENNLITSAATTFSKQSDHLKSIHLPYEFGFRIAGGFNATWMNLEILASWMRLYAHKHASVPKLPVVNFTNAGIDQPVTYFGYWNSSIATPTGQIYYANNDTDLHWDQIDLAAKIPLMAVPKFTLSPLLGVRGLISTFKSKTKFFTTQYGSTNTLTPPFNENITDLKQDFNAIGLMGGLDGDLNFGCGFHFSALVEGALIYGNLKTHNNQNMIVPVQPTVQVPVVYNNSTKSLGFKPMIDTQVALSWNRGFWKDKITLNLHVGYEAHFIPHFFELIYFVEDNSSFDTTQFFDLTLQGLDAGIGISF